MYSLSTWPWCYQPEWLTHPMTVLYTLFHGSCYHHPCITSQSSSSNFYFDTPWIWFATTHSNTTSHPSIHLRTMHAHKIEPSQSIHFLHWSNSLYLSVYLTCDWCWISDWCLVIDVGLKDYFSEYGIVLVNHFKCLFLLPTLDLVLCGGFVHCIIEIKEEKGSDWFIVYGTKAAFSDITHLPLFVD